MVSTSFRAAASVIVISAFAIAGVHAATDNGRFAIEGAGLATCAAFTQARQARNPDDKAPASVDSYARFIGWVEGYLTGVNRYLGDTFDIAPWQSPELYGVIIGEHCEKNPNDRLFEVVQKMVITLTNDRLKQPSDMVNLKLKDNKGENRAISIYTEVVRHAQDELKKQGLYRGEVNGQWDEATQKGVAFYQAAVGLQDTGLPDPLTLWLLFSPQKTQVDAAAAAAAAKTKK
jgi:hypothetical protein